MAVMSELRNNVEDTQLPIGKRLSDGVMKFDDVGFRSVSWIFILGCTERSMSQTLICQMLVLRSLFQIAAFSIQFLELSFPIFVLSFGLCRIGITFQDASANGFIAILQNDSEYKMGFIHAAYGLGALATPLSATHFSQLTHWSSHYLVSLSLALLNISILAGVFRFSAQDECLKQAGETVPNKTEEIQHDNKFGQLMKYKSVHFLALFLVVYIGVEVMIGGWIVTFPMIVRGGGPSSGYVSTSFFGGLTLGRVILVEVTKKNHTAHILPCHLINGTIGWISACRAAGSALLPFVTGTVASKLVIESLEPLVLVMMILLGIVWLMVPKEPAG
ncbi:hypothetical protein BYT27DRAFT_7193599 [Phlegmacium glaucopus]|nr:hypothetical protein BYT27DRAFT_7193599 [Phlegmacium glaucopus]